MTSVVSVNIKGFIARTSWVGAVSKEKREAAPKVYVWVSELECVFSGSFSLVLVFSVWSVCGYLCLPVNRRLAWVLYNNSAN